MTELHAELALRVDEWRRDAYTHARYPAIAEILAYAIEGETTGTLRYLRAAQLRAQVFLVDSLDRISVDSIKPPYNDDRS